LSKIREAIITVRGLYFSAPALSLRQSIDILEIQRSIARPVSGSAAASYSARDAKQVDVNR